MDKKVHNCENCKHYAVHEGISYCYEDGDEVWVSKSRIKRGCCCWKDENDKTPDIDWP